METNEIQSLIETHIPSSSATVEGDGAHFNIVVISDEFIGQSTLAKQKMIYAILNPYISDGSIHAVSLKTYTVNQWQQLNG